jgi:hypothetical protein
LKRLIGPDFDRRLARFHPRLAGRIDDLAVLIVLPVTLIVAHVLTQHLDAPLRQWLRGKFEGQMKKVKREAVLF